MSLIVKRYLKCNIEGCNNITDKNSDSPNGFILRLDSKRRGWHSIGMKDICPECYLEVQKGNTIKVL